MTDINRERLHQAINAWATELSDAIANDWKEADVENNDERADVAATAAYILLINQITEKLGEPDFWREQQRHGK